MQDVDRITNIEAFPQPACAGRARVDAQPLRGMTGPEDVRRIGGHRGRHRHVGYGSPARPTELQRAIELSIDLVALLMDGAVMAPAQHREVRQRGGPALRPVPDVMTLAKRKTAAWEAAASISIVERSA